MSQNNESCTESDRPNFCVNLQNSEYSVMRTYISAISANQIKLYYTKFVPNTKKGQICIIHGYGENTDDYLIMAEYFAKRGYVVHMIDMRGFGYSGGSRVN
jgi:alpha-beta hydrolase superfamily lysophospholipase